MIFAFAKGAEGTSYNRMNVNMDIIEQRVFPLVGQGVINQAPAFGGNAGGQTGFVIMVLEDWAIRDISA